jgi:predicted nuclease of predicted toxin-antitoxin system
MSAVLKCMFDTRAFNLILDESVPVQLLRDRVFAHATHIQRDEINNTKDAKRRAALAQIFEDVVAASVPTDSLVVGVSRLGEARVGGDRIVPTTSAVWGVSRWGQSSWSASDNLYSSLKADLDKLNKSKRNNVQDALIAETSIKGGYVLITDDTDLIEVTKRYGGKCLSLEELLQQ